MQYDYIIIGSGPTGLACATEIKNNNKQANILILERESSLGGCHRVTRVKNNLFTEHGPRIYSTVYKNFFKLLKHHGLDQDKYFTEYQFSITPGNKHDIPGQDTISQIRQTFSYNELLTLGTHYLNCIINPSWYKNRSVEQVFKDSLTNDSFNYLDKICRLTDGAGANRYTAYQLLQSINQNALYTILQPIVPNDKPGGWVHDLCQSLKNQGVNFITNYKAKVQSIRANSTYQIYDLTNRHQPLTCSYLVIATPTSQLAEIVDLQYWNNLDLSSFNQISRYEQYIPFTLYWKQAINVKAIWGQGIGPWNIIWITMSDYFQSEGTLISCCISRLDQIGFNGKTANSCTEEELKHEVVQQLSDVINNIQPDQFVISPQAYYDGEWKVTDTAHMITPDNINIKFPFNDPLYPGLFSVGTHNGYSTYHYTTAESAVQNANVWASWHFNVVSNIITTWTLNQVIIIIVVIVLLVLYPQIAWLSSIMHQKLLS